MPVSQFQTFLLAARVSPLEEPLLFQKAYTIATPSRRLKADRYRFELDKRLCLGAELLLRYAVFDIGYLSQITNITVSPNGKPLFPDCGVHFNLSHSGEWVLCAVSCQPVGCDIQKIRPVNLKLARRFNRTEYEDIFSRFSELEQVIQFYRYWTLKESFTKATGLGLCLALNDFQIVLDSQISVIHSVNNKIYHFSEFSDIPGFCCAICSEDDCRHVKLQIIDMKEMIRKFDIVTE